jgi:methionine biosynthesis protein MetW
MATAMGTTSEMPGPRDAAGGRRKRRAKHYQTTGSRSIDELDPNSSYAKAYALIPPGSRVLDLGCGSGELASYLTARGDRVWGVDVNSAALAQAAASFVDTRVADLEETSLTDLFPGLRFDVVVFADVLEHVREPWSLLQAARSVLEPGGRVVASIPNFAHAAVRLAVVSGAMPYRGLGILDDTHVRFFTLNGITSLFEESGFRLQEIARTTLAFDQPSDLVPDVRLLRVPGEIERHVREDPENETLQFVVRAVMLPGEWDMNALRGRLHDVEARIEEQAIGLRNLRREHAAARALAEERDAQLHALERTVQPAADALRAELLAVTAEAGARGEQLQLAAARQAELEREVAGTFAALAAVKRERDDALLAHASEAEARRGTDSELARAKAAMREAIEQRDDARSVASEARAQLQGRENELAHRLEGAQREVAELRDALNTAREHVRVLTDERARFEAATAEAEQRAAALAQAQERLTANEAQAAELIAAAGVSRAGLENALAHAKHALLSAIEERDTFAAAARDAQARLARYEADAGEVHAALRSALRADAGELAGFRERARHETLVRIARDHDDLGAPEDGAQIWRAGAAT